MDKDLEGKAISMIHALLSHGAQINARNKEGKTALGVAENSAIKLALQKAGAKL